MFGGELNGLKRFFDSLGTLSEVFGEPRTLAQLCLNLLALMRPQVVEHHGDGGKWPAGSHGPFVPKRRLSLARLRGAVWA